MQPSPSVITRDLLADAAHLVISTQIASITRLSQHLRVRSVMAESLLQRLQDRHIVGPRTGVGMRRVLVPATSADHHAASIRTGGATEPS